MKLFFKGLGGVRALTVVCLIVCIFQLGCHSSQSEVSTSMLHPGWPNKLRLAYYVDDEHPGLRSKATEALGRYLEKRLGLPVQIFKTTEYGPMIEAMRGGKLDLNSFGTFSYLLAYEKAGAQAIACRGTVETGYSQYYSLIVVRSDSPLKSFEDLKNRASTITYAFVNPASTSGHLIPRAYMEQQGLVPETSFKEVIYPRQQNATLRTVFTGKADAGSISINTYNKLLSLGRIKPDELRIIWKSPAIPNGCFAVRRSLPEDLKTAIQDALVTAHSDYPEDWAKIKELYKYAGDPDDYFLKADDAVYDAIRELAKSIKNLDMLD